MLSSLDTPDELIVNHNAMQLTVNVPETRSHRMFFIYSVLLLLLVSFLVFDVSVGEERLCSNLYYAVLIMYISISVLSHVVPPSYPSVLRLRFFVLFTIPFPISIVQLAILNPQSNIITISVALVTFIFFLAELYFCARLPVDGIFIHIAMSLVAAFISSAYLLAHSTYANSVLWMIGTAIIGAASTGLASVAVHWRHTWLDDEPLWKKTMRRRRR